MTRKFILFAVLALCFLQSAKAANNNHTSLSDFDESGDEPTFSLSLFDINLDIMGLMSRPASLNFSVGLLPRIEFRHKIYSITPIFAIYDTTYKFYNDPESIYTREINMVNTGLMVSFGDFKKGLDLSGNFLYTEPKKYYKDTSRLKQFQFKVSLVFYASTKLETYNYLPSGFDYRFEVAFFMPGAMCVNLYAENNIDLYSNNVVNSHRAWRLINSSNLNIKSIVLDKEVTDYIISRYCLSSMFAAYPGVCDINRMSVLLRDGVTIMSPYFSNDNVAWYATTFLELGMGFFGEVGRDDFAKTAFRLSSSFETGFRIKGVSNLFARFTFFYPDNPSIGAKFYFSVNLN